MKKLFLTSILLASSLLFPRTAFSQTTTIQYWSNHGYPSVVNIAQNGALPCVSASLMADTGFITDSDPTNYAQFLSVLSVACSTTIRTAVVDDPLTQDVPAGTRHAGFYLGNTLDIAGVLGTTTLRFYDDNVLVETAAGSSLLSLLAPGGTDNFVYATVTSSFDEIEIEFGSLTTAIENLQVYYAFATAGTGTFEPVEDVSLAIYDPAFTATARANGDVLLSWRNAPEQCKLIVVERSGEKAGTMKALAKLPANGENHFADAQPLAGEVNLYRLRFEMPDGEVHYTPTQRVKVGSNTASPVAYPNPASDAIYLNAPAGGSYSWALRDAAGRSLHTGETRNASGPALIWSRSNGALPMGMYWLEVSAENGERWQQRLVIQ